MTENSAGAGPVERGVRPLVERLRSRAWEDRHHREYREEAAREIERLEAALQYALGGLALAYEAAQKHHNDEVLLHCGHHEAMLAKALERKT